MCLRSTSHSEIGIAQHQRLYRRHNRLRIRQKAEEPSRVDHVEGCRREVDARDVAVDRLDAFREPLHCSPSFEVVENSDDGRFELQRDGEIVSIADFTDRNGTVVIPHVGTAPAHRGQGYAGRLMDGTLDLIRSSGRSVVPLCPFAAQHIRDNPEYQDLLAS